MARPGNPNGRGVLGLLLAAALAAAAVPWGLLTGAASTLAATLDADTYVSSAFPTANNSNSASLRVGSNPTRITYLRFTVQGLASGAAAAVLQLYATGGGQDFSVSPVADTTWTESMTYAQAPAYGAAIATHGPFTASTWQSADLSSAVPGDGTYSFAVTSQSKGVFASSRAGTGVAPALLVTPAASTTGSSSTATGSTTTSTSTVTTTTSTSSTSSSTTGSSSTSSSSSTSTSTSTSSSTTSPAAAPPIMVIVEENQEYGTIIGNPSAPYLNQLASTHTSATQWYAVQHNSPTDYLALISGSTQNLPQTPPPYPGPTLVDELAAHGIGWRAYMEDMPYPCYTGGSTAKYVKYHDPFMYFTSILGTPSQCNRVVPLAPTLSDDLSSGSAPPFLFVVPNLCDDMHDSCSPLNDPVAQGDQWLQGHLPAVLSSGWYQRGGVVIITWDEGTTSLGFNGGSGGHIVTLVISANPHGAFTPGGDHYGTLRGIEEAYGVGLLGHSADAANGDLRPAF